MPTSIIAKKSLKTIIKEEYEKCALDVKYFLKKYAVIQHPKRGKIPFILYPFQEDVTDNFISHRYNIILKSRQLGISTLVAGYIVWMMTFHKDKNILIIATKQDVAKNLVTKCRVMYQGLPTWLRVEAEEDNKLSLKFVNGSQVKAISSGPEGARSEALSLLVLDEAAFIEKMDEIWTAANQTLAMGGDCIALSTPNGMGNWFHKTWQRALEKENNFFTTTLPWSVHPEHDQDWRDEQTVDLGERMAGQECDADFLASGETVIHPEILKFYEETYVKDPFEKRGIDQNYWIWEQPDYSRTYIVTADVSRGDGTDYSTAHVIDVENMRQVAEYKGMIDTTDFGNFLVTIATEYNNALLIIERENIGWAVIQQVINRAYANLFYSSGDLKYVDTLRQITNKYRAEEKKLKPGFSTTMKTRPLVISKIEQSFREKMIVIQSQRTLSECWTFVWHGNKAEARGGYNDDLLMALGIGLWVRDTALKLRQEGIDLTKMTIDKFKIESSYDAIYQPNLPASGDPYIMDLGDKSEDIRWLL